MDLKLAAELIHGFTHGVNVEAIDQGSEDAKRAHRLEKYFTSGVGTIQLLPNPIFPPFSRYLWDVFHYRYVVAAVGPPVKSVTFAVLNHQAMVILPPDWEEMILGDTLMQLGGIIYAGSQAIDYYNGLFAPGVITKASRDVILQRSKNYEAEYLRMLSTDKLNDYQKKVLKECPSFDTALYYERKPVEPPH